MLKIAKQFILKNTAEFFSKFVLELIIAAILVGCVLKTKDKTDATSFLPVLISYLLPKLPTTLPHFSQPIPKHVSLQFTLQYSALTVSLFKLSSKKQSQ